MTLRIHCTDSKSHAYWAPPLSDNSALHGVLMIILQVLSGSKQAFCLKKYSVRKLHPSDNWHPLYLKQYNYEGDN